MLDFSRTIFDDMEQVVLLLQQLSEFKPPKSNYIKIWDDFNNQNNVFPITMRENNAICGYGVVLIEVKIRGSKMAHIEDIVVDEKKRGLSYGLSLVENLCKIAREQQCYKISLECQDNNIKFYEKCGFKYDGNAMVRFL